MPACFQLFKKSNPEEGPVVLNKVDEEICAFLGAPVHETRYVCGWFDAIGFRLATGKTFAQIKEEFDGYIKEETAKGKLDMAEFYVVLNKIREYLDERYTPNSFYSRYKD